MENGCFVNQEITIEYKDGVLTIFLSFSLWLPGYWDHLENCHQQLLCMELLYTTKETLLYTC
jgi:hypothetical protein